MKTVLLVVIILVGCHLISAITLNCDGYFVEMAKLNKIYGIDYSDPAYFNRNHSEDSCIFYYLKFVESLGYDISSLLEAEESTPEDTVQKESAYDTPIE